MMMRMVDDVARCLMAPTAIILNDRHDSFFISLLCALTMFIMKLAHTHTHK